MDTLYTIGLVILGIVILIGIIRVLFTPYKGFVDLLMDIMLLDYLGDAFMWVLESISDIWDND